MKMCISAIKLLLIKQASRNMILQRVDCSLVADHLIHTVSTPDKQNCIQSYTTSLINYVQINKCYYCLIYLIQKFRFHM